MSSLEPPSPDELILEDEGFFDWPDDAIGWACTYCEVPRNTCDASRQEELPRKCCPDCDHKAPPGSFMAGPWDF